MRMQSSPFHQIPCPILAWPKSLHKYGHQQTITTLTSNILKIDIAYLETNQVIELVEIPLKTIKQILQDLENNPQNHQNRTCQHHNHTLRDNPQVCIYNNASFIPSDEHSMGNLACSHVYSPTNELQIVTKYIRKQKLHSLQKHIKSITIRRTRVEESIAIT